MVRFESIALLLGATLLVACKGTPAAQEEAPPEKAEPERKIMQEPPAKPPSSKEVALEKITAEYSKRINAADKDGNGSLNVAEFRGFFTALRKRAGELRDEADPRRVEKRKQSALKKYDENDDGKLDEAEKKAMAEDLHQKEIRDFDWNRDGKLNEREKKAMQWAREGYLEYKFSRADKDGNGEATVEELTAEIGYLSKLQ